MKTFDEIFDEELDKVLANEGLDHLSGCSEQKAEYLFMEAWDNAVNRQAATLEKQEDERKDKHT